MSVTPTDCSLDDRPIQGNDEVICFGALDYEVVQMFGWFRAEAARDFPAG
jgi:hypothetical protein